ncbi:MAG: carbohydrate ABC transporter permease [Vampirovibrionales bacterium]
MVEKNPRSLAWGWFLGVPLLLLVIFNLIPTLVSFACMGFQWDLLSPPQWVGFDNITALANNSRLGLVLGNTAFLIVSVTVAVVLCSVLVAWGIYTLPNPRVQTFLKTCFFAPYITPSVAMSLVFGWLCQPTSELNHVLQALGLLHEPMAFLQHPTTALPVIALVDVWKLLGYNMLLVLAGLQQLPSEVFEAATLDACPPWQQLWRHALPNLSGTLGLVGVTASLQALQTFDSVYLLTQGGPNGATQVLTFWLYHTAFLEFNIGQASVLAFLLLVLVVSGFGVKRLFHITR